MIVSRVAGLLLSFLLPVVPVYAEPQVRSEIQYYDIYGKTTRELRSQMDARNLCADKGITCDGRTDWFVRWNYQYREDSEGCSIDSVVVNVDTRIQMPRWADASNGGPALRAEWQRYAESLLLHENGHRDFGIEAGRKVENAILSTPPQNACAALGETANRAGDSALKAVLDEEIEYDRSTEHGKTQGARFG